MKPWRRAANEEKSGPPWQSFPNQGSLLRTDLSTGRRDTLPWQSRNRNAPKTMGRFKPRPGSATLLDRAYSPPPRPSSNRLGGPGRPRSFLVTGSSGR